MVEDYPSVRFDWPFDDFGNPEAPPASPSPVQVQTATRDPDQVALLDLRRNNQQLRAEAERYRELFCKARAHVDELTELHENLVVQWAIEGKDVGRIAEALCCTRVLSTVLGTGLQ